MSSNAATATEVPQAPGHRFQGGDEGEREKLMQTDFTYKRKTSLRLMDTTVNHKFK